MDLIDYLIGIKFDFGVLIQHDNETLARDITKTRKCLQEVENSRQYAALSTCPKIVIDHIECG
jgi:hypothetical protein